MARKTSKQSRKPTNAPRAKAAPKGGKTDKVGREIEQYEHAGAVRANNPHVGLVTAETDRDEGKRRYAYDPHLDPQLQWAGKAEHTSFEVPTVSLHVHERVDPKTILDTVRKRETEMGSAQMSLFAQPKENPPLREALDFYKHAHGWSNRLIAGDSLLVMNSLLEKEGMAGKVQMIYIDPPYGIRYGSNFQPFVNRRDVKDGKDEDLTQEPEMIRAFRDTWELRIHSYLTYLRDRLLLARELLHESGSCFVQISDENVHHVREVMDEVFGWEQFGSLIAFQKSSGQTSKLLSGTVDLLVWYARDRRYVKYRQLYWDKSLGQDLAGEYDYAISPNGEVRRLSEEEQAGLKSLPSGEEAFRPSPLSSQGYRENTTVRFTYRGKTYFPGETANWKTTVEGL